MEIINKYRPVHPLLKDAVSSIVFWRRSADCTDAICSLPNNISGFGFTLWGDFYVKTPAGLDKLPAFGTRNLFEKPSEIITTGEFLNISVRCIVPNGLCLFTKMPMNIVYGECAVSLEDIFTRQEIQDIKEQLIAAASDEERMVIVEAFLLAKIGNKYPLSFRAIIEFIHDTKGLYNLTYIANKFNASERTINRHFNRYVGISPNAYINLVRFRSVISLTAGKDVNALSNAFEVGYYDQSHFIRHFKEFSAQTPAKFFSKIKEGSLSDFYNL